MKKNIAIVMGGNSGEYDISIQSGKIVEKYLDKTKYNAYPVIVKGNDWYHKCPYNNEYEIDKNDFSIQMIGERIKFDCVFVAIHGTPGEDGKMLGYLDIVGIPYTSSDHLVSALTFNKHLTKQLIGNMGVLTARSLLSNKQDSLSPEEILSKLELPLFIKPNNGGSSVGMSRVNETNELNSSLEIAFREDDEILIEEFIEGREITCGVFLSKGEIITLPITEIISKREFFDYEAKYDPSLSEEIVPAQIEDNVFQNCQSISADLYKKLQCKGLVRFDYIYNDKGIFFLEVNTVPGLTEASIVPKMAFAQGYTLTELFNIMIEEVLE